MRKTALASDLDGTLLFHREEKFSEETGKQGSYFKDEDLAAVAAWQARGGMFGLCSGRAVAGMFDMLPNGIRPDFYILCTGAVIFDRDENVIYEALFPREEAEGLLERYRDGCLFVDFHVDSREVIYRTGRREELKGHQVPLSSMEDVKGRKIYSVSLVFEDDPSAEMACREVNEAYPSLEGFQNKNSVDIVPRGCSKGDGILRVKEHLRVDRMAGIGDSFNDIPMLEKAQVSFTFHSSPESIRSKVTHVVDSVAEALALLGES